MAISFEDVVRHNTAKACWVVIAERVYDVTDLIDDHPGGSEAILRHAGKDATQEYELFHAAGTVEKHLPKGWFISMPIVGLCLLSLSSCC